MVFRRSHCSSLPPCSEMIFQQVTLIDLSFRDHTSHVVCAFMSACMCDAIQFCNFWTREGSPAMSEEQQPNRAWKRQVVPCGPEWMTASVARLEETRAETLDSARKRQREAESAEPAAESSGSGLQTTLLSQESLPPPVAEDMRRFRHVTMTPASFIPQRHLFMCAGRPMVVPCFMYSPHLQPFSCQVSVMLPGTRHRIIPCYGIVLGRLQSSVAFRTHASFGASSHFFEPIFFRAYCACIHLHPWSVRALLPGARHEPRSDEGGRNEQLLWEQVLSCSTGVLAGVQLQGQPDVQT